jgi:polyhydroxybutyrate depolymerase
MMRRILTAMMTLACLLTASCGGEGNVPAPVPPTPTTPPAPTIPYPVGISDQKISIGGVERQFLVHVPPGLTSAKGIVVVLHGGGGSGPQTASLTSSPMAVFRTVADREGLIAVFPTAIDANWNDCRSDAPGISNTVNDVAFFDALLSRLGTELNLDARRMFMSGISNGAMMSMRYALERPDRIAAIAIASGSSAAVPDAGPCTTGPARPVPIMMTHGELDTMVPYEGGCVARLLVPNCAQGTVIGAEATRDRWLQYNGLTATPPIRDQTNSNPDDGGPAERSRYQGATPVEWWKLIGAGHNPPSRTVFLDRALGGVQNRDVEFAEIAWTFFAARLP